MEDKKTSTYTFQRWWQNRREANRRSNLREELWLLLYSEAGNEKARAQRLIDLEKCIRCIHPGKSESWYLKKVIYDLRKRFSAY